MLSDMHGRSVILSGPRGATPLALAPLEGRPVVDRTAPAVRNAQLYREVERYRDRLELENAYLQEAIAEERGFEGIVGESPALRAVLRKVQQVAPVETTVLLTGETGTGKELVARALHQGSPRRDRPLIKVNCGAIPQGVVESELFGHEKGAFTGALQRRIGRFELADQGTLFLDEVGELPLDTQVKLLRVLQEQEFERVGSHHTQRVDVRLVAATNRDLGQEVAAAAVPGRPVLSAQRVSDPGAAVAGAAERHPAAGPALPGAVPAQAGQAAQGGDGGEPGAAASGMPGRGTSASCRTCSSGPACLSPGPVVEILEELQVASPSEPAAGPMIARQAGIVTLEENERIHIRQALAASGGRIHGPDGAAALLGINPSTLRSRMKKLGIAKVAA